jgi:hypothetical protein
LLNHEGQGVEGNTVAEGQGVEGNTVAEGQGVEGNTVAMQAMNATL